MIMSESAFHAAHVRDVNEVLSRFYDSISQYLCMPGMFFFRRKGKRNIVWSIVGTVHSCL